MPRSDLYNATVPAKKKPGKPPHEPTEQMRSHVATLTGLGISPTAIATFVKLDHATLKKHYQYELDTGATRANIAVSRALYKNAVERESVPAQIWWTKARMGWKDHSVVETNASEPAALHLLAAQLISDKLSDARRDGRLVEAPTIDGHAEPETGDWRDAPKPKE